MASFVSSSLKTGRLIFIWPSDSLWGCQPQCGCLEPPNLSGLEHTDEEAGTELWSLLNLWSGKGEGDEGGATHDSHCPPPQSWPHCGAQPYSWYTGLGPHLGTSHNAAAVGRLAGHGDWPWSLKLNGLDTSGMEWGCPGPIGLMHPLAMAWVINCLPSPRLTRLALSWACLPTQPMALDSVSAVSHALPRFSPSPNDQPIKQDGLTWACHYSFCWARFAISDHVFHNWCLPGMWGWWCCSSIFSKGHLYFQTIQSLRLVRCWFACQRLGWWMQWGATKCLWIFRAILASWWCEGVALSPDITPGFWSSRSLNLTAIDMKTVAMNWNSG